MVDIQSKEVIDKISDELKIQPSLMIPRGLAKDIQLTYEVNPARPIIKTFRQSVATSGSNSIAPSPSVGNKIFHVTGVTLNMQENATSDNIRTHVSATALGGGTIVLAELNKLTTTATTREIYVDYSNNPVPIAQGTNITLNNSFSAGAANKGALVIGYFADAE